MATSRLALPSRKLSVVDIQTSKPVNNHTSIKGLHVWEFRSTNPVLNLQFSIVWVQGRISEIFEANGGFTLEDQTGIITITKLPSTIQAKKNISKGNYVQVIGEVIETGHHPVIRSMKIQDLSQQTCAPNLWMPEIEHMKHLLSQHYSSGIVILQG